VGAKAFALGDKAPTFVRRGDFATWSRFAAVNYEIADHHMDDEVAQHEGFSAAFAMAPLVFSYMQTLLRNWGGMNCHVVEANIRLKSPFLRGRNFVANGEITQVDVTPMKVVVTTKIWAHDDLGTQLVAGTGIFVIPTDL
jgi:hypothetical protein